MANNVFMTHTLELKEPKNNIKNYIKGINVTQELAEYLNYLTEKNIKIDSIGKMIKNKCPFIVNYNFSQEALENKKPIFYSVKELNEEEENMLKTYLYGLLREKVDELKNTSKYDKETVIKLKKNFKNIKLATSTIPDEVLEDDLQMSILWSVYISYLLTKGEMTFKIEEEIPKTKNKLLKMLKDLNVNEEEINQLSQLEEWDNTYLDKIKPKGTKFYAYKKVYPQGKTDNQRFGYTFHTEKTINTRFRLKNNGSLTGCMSDVLCIDDDKLFSININIFFEHTLSNEYEGNFIINISTTSWISSEEAIILNTEERSSLYICPSPKSNHYARLDIYSKYVETKEDRNNTYKDKNQHNVSSCLSNSEKIMFNKFLGENITLESILDNPKKYAKNRLINNLAFAGIPISAPLKKYIKDYAEPGLSIKDKTLIYDSVFEKLKKQGLNVEKGEYLEKVNTKGDLKSSVGFNSTYVQMKKTQYLNKEVDTYIICYWGNDDRTYKEFKAFVEKLKVSKNDDESILIKKSENEYIIETSNKNLKFKLIKCNIGDMTKLIRPQKNNITKQDIKINSIRIKKYIISEFKNNGIDIQKKQKNVMISNIVEIPAYHNNLAYKKFDPCYSIRMAFASLGLNIQVINEIITMKEKKEVRLKKIALLKENITKQKIELSDLNKLLKVSDKQNILCNIKELDKEIADSKENLEKAIKSDSENDKNSEKTKLEVFKSSLLDCFSKKGITAKIETNKFNNGDLGVYSFAIVKIANEVNILLLSMFNKDGLFIKDISCDYNDEKFKNDWITIEDFPILVNRYLHDGKNKKLEEYKIWSRIENEINQIGLSENVLLISASERRILKDLTNSKITRGIRVLKSINNLTLVRVNDFNDVPFGSVYKIEESLDGKIKLKPKNDQGLYKKNENIYYDKSSRGDTLKVPGTLTKTKFSENQMLAARKSIEFFIISNYLNCNDEIASLVSALRQLTIAFEVSTNKPYPLHIVEQLAKEFKL